MSAYDETIDLRLAEDAGEKKDNAPYDEAEQRDELEVFFKSCRSVRDCYFSEVCSDIKDEYGEVVKWKFRPLKTEEEEEIREESMEIKDGQYRLNRKKYIEKLVTASVMFPNLMDARLQDSYNAKTPETLLKRIVTVPGEYTALCRLVQEKNGFVSLKEDVEQAKN